MAKATIGVQILMGLIFTVFGINGFLNFLPQPEVPAEAGAFIGALMAAKFLPVVKAIEVIAGLMVLTGMMVPLGLLLLAPIIVCITLFHVVLAPAGLPMAIALIVFEGFLAWRYKHVWAPILAVGTKPG